MSNIKFVIYPALCFCWLSACVSDTSTKKKPSPASGAHEQGPVITDSSIKIFTEKNNKYVTLDTTKFKLPDGVDITPSNIFNGIYEVRPDSLKKHKFLITEKLAFLTTFQDVGFGYRGYLYVFDLASKSLIRDTELKHDYLYSSVGIFVIDPANNKIFAVDKGAWFDAKQASIVPASLYTVKDGDFKFIKNVYQFASDVPADTALLSFFKNSVSAHSDRVFSLPDDWWKTK